MRIFLAGATGVIGIRLIPLLVEAGHEVAGMTRSAAGADRVRDLGAAPVVCDVYDIDRLTAAVGDFRAELLMHQLTALPDSTADIPAYAAANNRIRTEGTRNLLAAAAASGAGRFVAQSVAWQLPGAGGVAAAEHERMVLAAGGVVIRYGQFYGPGTYHPDPERPPAPPRIHIDAAARRSVPLLEHPSGVVTLVDE